MSSKKYEFTEEELQNLIKGCTAQAIEIAKKELVQSQSEEELGFKVTADSVVKESKITSHIENLQTINYQIAELSRIKEAIEYRLYALFHAPEDGQKKYIFNQYALTFTSGYNYSLNKEEYEMIKNHIPSCFNPVRERIAYDIDKKVIREAEMYASKEELELLDQCMEKKKKKLHVKITAGV